MFNREDLKIPALICAIGALNWGLVGLFNFDLIAFLFGIMTTISRIIYALVGFAGVWIIYQMFKANLRRVELIK